MFNFNIDIILVNYIASLYHNICITLFIAFMNKDYVMTIYYVNIYEHTLCHTFMNDTLCHTFMNDTLCHTLFYTFMNHTLCHTFVNHILCHTFMNHTYVTHLRTTHYVTHLWTIHYLYILYHTLHTITHITPHKIFCIL